MKATSRRMLWIAPTMLLALPAAWSRAGEEAAAEASTFKSRWDKSPDRIWIGPEYWSNPMEDWCIRDGRVECTSIAPGRNLHVLTRQLGDRPGGFSLSVHVGLAEGTTGAVGFEVGICDQILDYRGNCFFGTGVQAFATTDGELRLAGQTEKLEGRAAPKEAVLRLDAQPQGTDYRLTLTAIEMPGGETLGSVEATVPAERLVGNLALIHNPKRAAGAAANKTNARFWFRDWRISGEKVIVHDDQTFGPILWAMHTVSNSRGEEGYVMKITAQMPPIGERDSPSVRLQVARGDDWRTVGRQGIDADSRTATFRVAHWPQDRNVPYRLVYTMRATDGSTAERYYEGTVRRQPDDGRLVLGAMTCQFSYGFPYTPLVKNLAALNPDMLYFSGDQIYESNGGFGIVRRPDERAIVNYLRKQTMFGWAFGDLMRDRPTLCLPDDHDVFHGNLWGEGGAAATTQNSSTTGGYIQSPRFVNVVHRCNTSHHPDRFDPMPAKQNISVYYGDMVYGRVSFALVGDREFKSGPGRVDTGGGRADHVLDPNIDPRTLDRPELTMLGQRQLKFLDHWVEDWRGADMKVLLSETLFANAATHHGSHDNFLYADLDSGGWPTAARNRAIRTVRKAFPLHINGDQHVATLIQYGVDQQRDSNWSFCTPAITVGYQRWYRADEIGRPYENRPAHGLANTGEYLDGFGNKFYLNAVANPEGSSDPNRYTQAHIRASGFGVVRIDGNARTYTCESYRFLADLANDPAKAQFPGWPLTIRQAENYGRKPLGYLAECSIEGVEKPVVEVIDEATGELVYALRAPSNKFRPWVFADGKYTLKIGDPDRGVWKTLPEQTIQEQP